MEIDLKNMYKEDNKTWTTIYEAFDEFYFKWFTLYLKDLREQCKNNQNVPHNITFEIKIETTAL